MATITRPETTTPVGLRPELDGLLDRLRGRIRSYVAAEGTAVVLALVGGCFWLTLGLDYASFKLTNFELPVAVRAVLLALAAAATLAAVATLLVLRLARRLRPRALALVLERRFPELDDRLILAVEQAEQLRGGPADPVSEAMLSRSIAAAAEAAERVEVADVFDRRPLRRAVVAAAVLLGSAVVAVAVWPALAKTWWAAYGRFEESYYPRTTALQLTVLAPPDDRPRPLSPGGVYKHPRGANLTLLVEVPEGKRPDGQPWTVPEAIYARRKTDAGARQTVPAARASDRSFRLSIDQVRDGMTLSLSGDDYTTPTPYRIEVVDPPRAENVRLSVVAPGYTGLNDRDAAGRILPETVNLAGAVAEVPQGSFVLFGIQANKPVRSAVVRFGEQELTIAGPDSADGVSHLFTPGAEGSAGTKIPLPAAFSQGLIAADGRSVVIPVLVTAERTGFLPTGAADRTDVPRRPMIAVAKETPVRVTFEDADEVVSLEPSRFDLRGRADEPPKVETKLRGVSGIITREAVVPVRGSIRDDYGLTDARFDFKIGDAEDWASRPFAKPPAGYPKEFALARDAGTPAEWFDAVTLDLAVGQKLTVAVAAEDGDTLTGPHLVRGEPYVFTIVTREELLSALYNQEINLRKRFEQSLGEIKAVRDDLAAGRSRAEEVRNGKADPQAADAIRSTADRSLAETQQNAGEVAAVADSFGEILEQLVNNRVHTEKQLDRIRVGILQPLRRLADERFPTLDRAIGELRVRIADGDDPRPGFDASADAADAVIAEMEAALKEMQDLAEFHEAIQELSKIFEDEKDLRDRTQEEQKRAIIDNLGGLLD